MRALKPTNKTRVLIICLLLISLAILSFVGHMDKAIELTGLNTLQFKALGYLESSFDKSFNTFLTLSTLKVGLDIIEGSTIDVGILGSGTSVEVGDIVQSAYDQVDFAWKVTFIGGISILILQILIRIAIVLDSILLGITLLIGVLWLFAKYILNSKQKYTLFLKKSFGCGLLFSLFMYILLPAAILTSSLLTTALTADYRLDAEQEFEYAYSRVQGVSDMSSISSISSIPSKVTDFLKDALQMLEDLAKSVFFFIAALILDCIIFPLGILWLSWKFTKLVFSRYFGIRIDKRYEDQLVLRLKEYLENPRHKQED